MKTIARRGTEGSSRGRFYPPLDVFRFEQRVYVRRQGDNADEAITLWPDEAIELGVALIQKATEEQVLRALGTDRT